MVGFRCYSYGYGYMVKVTVVVRFRELWLWLGLYYDYIGSRTKQVSSTDQPVLPNCRSKLGECLEVHRDAAGPRGGAGIGQAPLSSEQPFTCISVSIACIKYI